MMTKNEYKVLLCEVQAKGAKEHTPEAYELMMTLKAFHDALEGLLDDTQHRDHKDCASGPCPVREAREVLEFKTP